MEEALFVFLFLLIWLVVVFAVIIAVGLYILKAIAFQKLMRKFNYRKSWMAWIPFAQYYALADTAAEGKSTIKFFGADAPAWLFKFWYLFTYVAAFIPFIGPVAIAVFKVLILGNLYRTIYARAEKRTLGSRTALGIFSAIIELIPIIKFLHYDSSKVEPMEETAAPAPEPVPLITAVAPEKAVPVQAPAAAPVAQPASAPVQQPAFCMVCGAKLVPGAVFCSNCGTKVGSTPAAKAEPVPVMAAEPEAAPAAEAPVEVLAEVPAAEAPVEVPAVVEEVKEAAAEVVVSAETAAEEAAETAEAAVEEAAETAAEAAEAVQEEISEAAEAVDTVSEAAVEAAEEVAEAVESAEEVAEEAAEEIKEEA